MNDDGIALTSIVHPTEHHWAKRLWGWLWPRDIDPAALEDVEIEIPDQTHLIWPIFDDSLLIGATEFERAAEEMRANEWLFAHVQHGTRTHWRRSPHWVEERDFERQQDRSYFTWRVTLTHPS